MQKAQVTIGHPYPSFVPPKSTPPVRNNTPDPPIVSIPIHREQSPTRKIFKVFRATVLFIPLLLYFLSQLGFISVMTFIQDALTGVCFLGMEIPGLGNICQQLNAMPLRILSPSVPPIQIPYYEGRGEILEWTPPQPPMEPRTDMAPSLREAGLHPLRRNN